VKDGRSGPGTGRGQFFSKPDDVIDVEFEEKN